MGSALSDELRDLIQGRMGGQILVGGNTPGDHRFCLGPVFLNEEGKVEMNDQAGDQGGGEEAVENSA